MHNYIFSLRLSVSALKKLTILFWFGVHLYMLKITLLTFKKTHAVKCRFFYLKNGKVRNK
jgi:hypothetical protein